MHCDPHSSFLHPVSSLPARSRAPVAVSSVTIIPVGLHLFDIVTGSGLVVLIGLAGSGLDPGPLIGAVASGGAAVLLWAYLASPIRAPVWLCFASGTVNLVLTLAVALNLFARVCPPQGKELALIPAYALLCMARLPLAQRWPMHLMAWTFILAFGGMVLMDSQEMETGFVGFDTSVEPQWLCFALLALFVAYDGVSQWCRVSEALVHFPAPGEYPTSGVGYALDAALWGLARWALLVGLAMLGRGAFAYLFLAPLPTYSDPYVPNYLGAFYGSVLLLSCMCAASVWFRCLQRVAEALSRRAYGAQRLARLQHVLHALIVGAAWAFPFDSQWVCLGVLGIATGAVVVGAALGAERGWRC